MWRHPHNCFEVADDAPLRARGQCSRSSNAGAFDDLWRERLGDSRAHGRVDELLVQSCEYCGSAKAETRDRVPSHFLPNAPFPRVADIAVEVTTFARFAVLFTRTLQPDCGDRWPC